MLWTTEQVSVRSLLRAATPLRLTAHCPANLCPAAYLSEHILMLRNSSPFRQHLLALALYLAATIVFTWPLALNLTTAIPGDSFDGWQNYWNQWWIKQALIDRIANPLVTDLLYFPTGVSLYFHTLNPFNGVTTLPIQLAFGLIAAYNAVVFLSWVLAGYGMFLLARWVIEGRGARGEGRYAPVAAVSIPQKPLSTSKRGGERKVRLPAL
jgi:hypothetical protein